MKEKKTDYIYRHAPNNETWVCNQDITAHDQDQDQGTKPHEQDQDQDTTQYQSQTKTQKLKAIMKTITIKSKANTVSDARVEARRSQHSSQECEDSRRQCFVTRDLDLWSFYPKINAFPGLIVEHFYVKFGDPSCIGLETSCGKIDTHIQTEVKNPTTSAWVMIHYTHHNYLPTEGDGRLFSPTSVDIICLWATFWRKFKSDCLHYLVSHTLGHRTRGD